MHHGNRLAVRRRHHVDLRIYPTERALQHDHCENGGACRYIAGALGDRVCRDHAGSGIAFRWTERCTGLQLAGRIQQLCTLRCQPAGLYARGQDPWKNVQQLPSEMMPGNQPVKAVHHIGVVGHCGAVDREHARRLADAKNAFSGQLPMYVSCQRCQIIYGGNMRFLVQNRLIQVRDAPALRNIKRKLFGQQVGRPVGNGVSPCTKWNQLIAVAVKCQIAVHHAAEADCIQNGDRTAVPHPVPVRHIAVARLQAVPYLLQRIGPDAIDQLIFPCMTSCCKDRTMSVGQDGLDSCRTEFNAQHLALRRRLYIELFRHAHLYAPSFCCTHRYVSIFCIFIVTIVRTKSKTGKCTEFSRLFYSYYPKRYYFRQRTEPRSTILGLILICSLCSGSSRQRINTFAAVSPISAAG